jgi:hypothetical protein
MRPLIVLDRYAQKIDGHVGRNPCRDIHSIYYRM